MGKNRGFRAYVEGGFLGVPYEVKAPTWEVPKTPQNGVKKTHFGPFQPKLAILTRARPCRAQNPVKISLDFHRFLGVFNAQNWAKTWCDTVTLEVRRSRTSKIEKIENLGRKIKFFFSRIKIFLFQKYFWTRNKIFREAKYFILFLALCARIGLF